MDARSFWTCSRQSSVCVVKEYREFACLGCGLLIVLVDFLLERNRFTEKSYLTYRLRSTCRCKMMYSSRFYLWFLNLEDIVFHFACISGVTKSEKTDWLHYVWYLCKSPGCYHRVSKIQVTDMIFILTPIDTSVIRVFHKYETLIIYYCYQRLYDVKQKNPTTKCYLQWALIPGTYDFKSDSLLSELTWHLLVSLGLYDPYIVMLYWFWVIHLSPKVKWCMNRRHFKDHLRSICQVTSERRLSDLETEVPCSILTGGNILLLEFFVFT